MGSEDEVDGEESGRSVDFRGTHEEESFFPGLQYFAVELVCFIARSPSLGPRLGLISPRSAGGRRAPPRHEPTGQSHRSVTHRAPLIHAL